MNAVVELREHWEEEFPIVTDDQIVAFARAIGDKNPIHSDVTAAHEVGLTGIVAPGVMLLGMISSALADEIPGCMVLGLEMRFRRPIYAGALPYLIFHREWIKRNLASFIVEVKNRTDVLASGSCTLCLL